MAWGICPVCGKPRNLDPNGKCPGCNSYSRASGNANYCENCRKPIPIGERYCDRCKTYLKASGKLW